MPDAAVIQQNYGEDDTESNLVTDKLDEESDRRREKNQRHTKNELCCCFWWQHHPPSQCGNCHFGGLLWHCSQYTGPYGKFDSVPL